MKLRETTWFLLSTETREIEKCQAFINVWTQQYCTIGWCLSFSPLKLFGFISIDVLMKVEKKKKNTIHKMNEHLMCLKEVILQKRRERDGGKQNVS